MVKKSHSSIPQQKQLSVQEMAAAITKIDRCLRKLKNFDIEMVNGEFDPNLQALEYKLDQLLLDIFGADSAQYNRYFEIKDLYHPSMRIGYTPPLQEVHARVKKGIDRTSAVLEVIKEGFQEELGDGADQDVAESRIIKAYRGLDLHPVVAEAANGRYLDGYYADAIESAVKALSDYVRKKSGILDKDGAALMEHVFSVKNPILKFNDLVDESDRNEQKGFMQWFGGTVTALRNPRAHKLIQDNSETALEFIAFVSLLAKLVDKSTAN